MGRHREYDTDEVLEAALKVFWRRGYEGTSYSDLTEATGVERPTLYAAFGNKEALFKKVLERYGEQYMGHVPAALALQTSREVAAHLLYGAIDVNTRYTDHTGCLGVSGALAGSDESEPVRQALVAFRAEGEARLRERFERDQKEGDLPATAKPEVLAAFLMAILHGMAVQARAGFSSDVLRTVADQALLSWPAPASTGTNTQ